MIFALGLDSDHTFRHFLTCALWSGVEVQPINLRELASDGHWRLIVPDDGNSVVTIHGEHIPLDPHGSYYWRPIDLASVQESEAAALRWRGLMLSLGAWLEVAPGRVINRLGARNDNCSKPLHEVQLARLGFKVPPSLTSADPAQLGAFTRAGATIVKALSGVRADTRLVAPEEFDEMHPLAGPVHLQRYISGDDVRIHVVDDAVFPELISTEDVDYRRAVNSAPVRFESLVLPAELEAQLIEATRQYGLAFAGWDFKLDGRGTYWCLEVNPMPGYEGYDLRAEGQITRSLLSLLQTGIARARL